MDKAISASVVLLFATGALLALAVVARAFGI
jgi:hypothetical protein